MKVAIPADKSREGLKKGIINISSGVPNPGDFFIDKVPKRPREMFSIPSNISFMSR